MSARLIEVQEEIPERSLGARLWTMPGVPRIAGCAVAFAPGEAGPGQPGDRAWAAAVLWRPEGGQGRVRRKSRTLRGRAPGWGPRQAADVEAQVVVAGVASASYAPGLLAAREGPVLAKALELLDPDPEVLMVDATGLDHPRLALGRSGSPSRRRIPMSAVVVYESSDAVGSPRYAGTTGRPS